MMADFPPNLDDGELWLPSDIFLNDHCPCMLDDLAHNFAAMALQQPPRNRSTPPTYPSNNFQGFKPIQPPVRDESVLNPNATWPLGLSRSFHSLRGNSRTGCYAGWPEPSSKPLRSAPSQVKKTGDGRWLSRSKEKAGFEEASKPPPKPPFTVSGKRFCEGVWRHRRVSSTRSAHRHLLHCRRFQKGIQCCSPTCDRRLLTGRTPFEGVVWIPGIRTWHCPVIGLAEVLCLCFCHD